MTDDQAVRLAALRQALDEGAESGPTTAFDFDSFIARKRAGNPIAAEPE